MRCIRIPVAWAALGLLAVSLGCGGEEGKKDAAAGPSGGAAPAKADGTEKAGGQAATIDTAYILPEDFLAVVLQPRRIAESPLVAAQLKDEQVAESIKKFGIAPSEVEQFDFFMSMVEVRPKHAIPLPTVIAHFNHAIDPLQVLTHLQKTMAPQSKSVIQETEVAGKKCIDLKSGDDFFGFSPNATTLMLVHKSLLEKIMAGGDPKAPLAQRLAKANADNDVILVTAFGAAPQFVEELETQTKDEAPIAKSFAAALKGVEGTEAVVNIKGATLLRLVIDAKDAAAADAIHELLKDVVKEASGGLTMMKQSMPPEVKPALLPMFKLGEDALDGAKIAKEGTQVTAVIARPANMDAAFGPQFEQVKKLLRGHGAGPGQMSAPAATGLNNTKQVPGNLDAEK